MKSVQLLVVATALLTSGFIVAEQLTTEQLRGLNLLNQVGMKSSFVVSCERNYCQDCEIVNAYLIAAKEYGDIVKALRTTTRKNGLTNKILQERLKGKGGSEEKCYYDTLNDNAQKQLNSSVERLLRTIDVSFMDQEEGKIEAIVKNEDVKK